MRHVCSLAWRLTLVVLAVFASCDTSTAPDAGADNGRLQVSSYTSSAVAPTAVPAGRFQPITVTFTGVRAGVHDGAIELAIPAGWPAPSTSHNQPGYVTASEGNVTTRAQTIVVSDLTLGPRDRLRVEYGTGAAGAATPELIGRYSFAVALMPRQGASWITLRPVSVRVVAPRSGCLTRQGPTAQSNTTLPLLNGIARANLWNVSASSGTTTQCITADGLVTSISLSSASSAASGPLGYPEAAYGFSLGYHAFCPGAHVCQTAPFPLRIGELSARAFDYRLEATYTIEPSSSPSDILIDLFLERAPTALPPGVRCSASSLVPGCPTSNDIELEILPFHDEIGSCNSTQRDDTLAEESLVVSGRDWTVCAKSGSSNQAEIVAFTLNHQLMSGHLNLRIKDFVDAAAAYGGRGASISGYSLMGVELGGEVGACSGVGCVTSSTWQLRRFYLRSQTAMIPIVDR
jgi:hypothetical protein